MNDDKTKNDIENKIFFSKYKPEKKIGEGSFGKIYSANNILTNEKFALKLENKTGSQNLLESEAYVLCYLKGGNMHFELVGIPAVKSYGFSGDHNVLVMELLGKSLEDLFQQCGGKFSLKTVCMIGLQILDRIEYVHTKHIIHRDIKPDNFVIGIENNTHTIYIIDFGLAKKYRSSRNLQHIVFRNNKKLTGTARYASINALKGVEQSRRDDLEAIGYVLMYFLKGVLPWQGLKVDKKEDRYKKIYDKKKATTAEDLCSGFPSEFCTYIKYSRGLTFEQNPDYEYLRGLLKKVMENNYFSLDYEFGWNTKYKEKTGNPPAITITSKNTLNNNSNFNNVLMTTVSNQVETNFNSFKANEKVEDIERTGPLLTNIAITNQEEGGIISKPNKFVVNETKNKFESFVTKTENSKVIDIPNEVKQIKQEIDAKCEKKKDDNCLIN